MASTALSVLTWNINFRAAETLDPIAALPSLPDVVTLQEAKLKHASAIRARLDEMGYETAYSGRSDAEKQYGNVIAARTLPESCGSAAFHFPYPELIAHAQVDTPGRPANVVTVHVPNGSGHGWKKIDTLEALKQMVLGLNGEPLVLTGDFNEPQWAPLQDGHIITWGRDWDGERWSLWEEWMFDGVTGPGKRWDAAVRWLFESPDESGIRNAFWDAHGHGSMEQTHIQGGRPRWFDHVFVSRHFKVEACAYRHKFRTDGHSDHSALEAELIRRAPG